MFKKVCINNFRDVMVRGHNALNYRANAKVDVTTTTGFFKRKKIKETRNIHKKYAEDWFFVDTGEHCNPKIENLQRIYEANKGHDIWQTR